MAIAALVAWVVTAGGGLVLFGTWLTRGGPAQHRAGHSRFAPGSDSPSRSSPFTASSHC